ncbi:hypothetical protein L6R49_10505 [Myxococcota bacterium]|nr:hypothetical protein [Myxococcota bacterium]
MLTFSVNTITEEVRDEHGQALLRVTSTRTDGDAVVGQRIDYCTDPARVPLLKARQYASLIEEDVSLVVTSRHAEAGLSPWRLVLVHVAISVLAILVVATIHFGWWP